MDCTWLKHKNLRAVERDNLQNLAVTVVLHNFDIFINEFKSETSAVPKHYFHFLQRIYSQEILEYLLQSKNLKEEYLDFVINSNLRKAEFSSTIKYCNVCQLNKRLIKIGKYLQKFSVTCARNLDYLKPSLHFMPNLRVLNLEYADVKDEDLSVISEVCSSLLNLSVYVSSVTDEGVQYLCYPIKHKLYLESLNISRSRVKAPGLLMVLENIPTLKHLSHEQLSSVVHYAGVNSIFTKERSLNLIELIIGNVDKELNVCADICPNIKRLFIQDIKYEKHLSDCCKFTKVENVIMAKNKRYPNLNVNGFLKMCGLYITMLCLKRFTFSIEVLIRSCPSLVGLELTCPDFEPFTDTNLKNIKFEHLNYLEISTCTEVSYWELKSLTFILSLSPKLSSLTLENNVFSSDLQDLVLNSPLSFTQLNFQESLTDLDFLEKVIRKYPKLRTLSFQDSAISRNDVHRLFNVAEEVRSRVHFCINNVLTFRG